MQAVDQQQEEIRDPGDRSADVAQRDDPRLLAMFALPSGQERNAAPCGVAADGTADVEMAAPRPFARLAVAFAQPARDLADQQAHLLGLPLVELRHRRVAKDFVAQVFTLFAPIQKQRL